MRRMEIEIPIDMIEALIVDEMEAILRTDTEGYHPDDVDYYRDLKKAAKIVLAHYVVERDEDETR